MGKLIGILVVLAVIAGAAYYFMNRSETGEPAKKADGPVRVEEKYGVTTQTP
jgi:flagellar basal body-associated protein FliL